MPCEEMNGDLVPCEASLFVWNNSADER
jgi:hypothetical protein